MSFKRLATLIFDGFLWLAFSALLILFMCGIYKGIKEEKKPEPVEYIELVEVVEPVSVTTSEAESEELTAESEEIHTETEEPHVVVLSYTVTERTETAQSEALYDVPLEADLQRFIISKAEEIGIDPAVIFAMARKESTYDCGAIGDNGDSLGLLQIQPRWNMERMERLGCMDLLDPYQNVTVAVDLLGELMNKHGDIAVALTVYNFGHYPGYVTDYATDVLNTAEGMVAV